MGADFYLRSLTTRAERRFRPKFNAAVRKRDQYFDERVAALSADGLDHTAAEQAVRQEECYVRLQAQVTRYWDELYCVDNGYFRDSYNESSLLSMFGLGNFRVFTPGNQERTTILDMLASVQARLADNSTWAVLQRLVDDAGCLTPARAQEFLQLLEAHEPTFYYRLDNMIEYWRQALGRELSNAESREWAEYFEDKYQTFRGFLQRAIDLDEAIHVSY